MAFNNGYVNGTNGYGTMGNMGVPYPTNGAYQSGNVYGNVNSYSMPYTNANNNSVGANPGWNRSQYQPTNNINATMPQESQPQNMSESMPAIGPYNNTAASNTNIIWVQGIEGGKSFRPSPGTTALLLDSDAPRFYLKGVSTDGRPELHAFRYEEILLPDTISDISKIMQNMPSSNGNNNSPEANGEIVSGQTADPIHAQISSLKNNMQAMQSQFEELREIVINSLKNPKTANKKSDGKNEEGVN